MILISFCGELSLPSQSLLFPFHILPSPFLFFLIPASLPPVFSSDSSFLVHSMPSSFIHLGSGLLLSSSRKDVQSVYDVTATSHLWQQNCSTNWHQRLNNSHWILWSLAVLNQSCYLFSFHRHEHVYYTHFRALFVNDCLNPTLGMGSKH